MQILMILERQFPHDERVEKEALSLIAEGYHVSILSFNYENLPAAEIYKGIEIHRFPFNFRAFRKLSPIHRIFPFYGMIWKRELNRIIREKTPDVLHVHDLPLANIGWTLKKKYGCKLVLDQHELWSETVKHYRHYNTFMGRIVRFLSFWKSYEKKYFQRADALITVEEPIKEWYVDHTECDPEKIYVLPNTPSAVKINNLFLTDQKGKRQFVLFYAGTIDINRHLSTVIRALGELGKKIPEIIFRISGKYARGCDPRITAEKYGVEKYVEYLGNLNFDEMSREMYQSDICICLLPVNSEELNRTIPTKVYQYMQLKKPMIVSRTTYMREFVESKGIGFSVDETDPEAFAALVVRLYKNPQLLEECGSREEKIRSRYVWEKTVAPLIQLYREQER